MLHAGGGHTAGVIVDYVPFMYNIKWRAEKQSGLSPN